MSAPPRNVYICIYMYIATYDFSSLYTTIPHLLDDKLIKIKRLCNVIRFVLEGENGTHICISKINAAYWGKSPKTT